MQTAKEHNLVENNILILSKQTMDLLLAQKNPADLISLYTFYYYTAKWQSRAIAFSTFDKTLQS